jgi:PAS domain S-box-containing protein
MQQPERRSRSRRQEDLQRDRLFELSLDILCVCGFDGVFRQVNPALERVLGYQMRELLARPFIEFVIPEDRDETRRHFGEVVQGKLSVTFENRWFHRDGGIRWLQWNGTPDVEQQLIYAAARDVTDRRRFEAELARLASIVESSDDAIIGMDLSGTIQTWNPGAERLFGWTALEARGRPMSMLTPPGHADHSEQVLANIQRGQRIAHYETFRRRKNGEVIGVSLSVSPVRDADGVLLGASSIIRDVTERRRAEAERLNLLQQLEHALSRAKRMTGTLHYCEVCHRVKDDKGYWTDVMRYIDDHADARPIPGRCPDHAEQP